MSVCVCYLESIMTASLLLSGVRITLLFFNKNEGIHSKTNLCNHQC